MVRLKSRVRAILRLRSIQGRYTTAAMALLLVVLVVVGVSCDLVIRYRIEDDVFKNAERVASQWSATARTGGLPEMIPASGGVDLVQLVNARGTVVRASRRARGRAPLSAIRPPSNDRFERLHDNGLLLMAIRVSPAPDAPVIYAGSAEPRLLGGHYLELFLAVAALVLLGLAGWLTWWVVGRTLRPVAAIRARMAEITGSDVSLRVPVPAGEDEFALLARTANQSLERLQEAVEQQRQFASTTSHELRTPIAGLRMQLEEALLYPDEVDAADSLRGALSATGRLEAIVNDLLLLARLRVAEPAARELIDLGKLVTEEAMQVSQSAGVAVYVHAASGVWVSGSQIRLIRVVGNLLSNARRHAAASVEVSVEAVDGRAVLAVVDDGAGVAPADRERVFERFTRLADGRRRDAGGSGLGLAISRDIAEAHRGSLRIEDSPRGARFVLRLPLLHAQSGIEGPASIDGYGSTPTDHTYPALTGHAEPVGAMDSELSGTDHPRPMKTSHPEPVATDRSEPTGTNRPRPTRTSRSEPGGTSCPEPAKASYPQPWGTSRFEPMGTGCLVPGNRRLAGLGSPYVSNPCTEAGAARAQWRPTSHRGTAPDGAED
ncbi:ATP-binding protein [Streptosporangium sp. 'caverna']|uniref:ATP-binding protein n=1 Tax=Streptosporangium sp. 'caverna' TaxID=2202249 RepID=UPI000D7DFEB4|nr:ATP-binding protein [Streptosporangium sp. 'caverna']AWS40395.1 two-component sensor histidine kinase [Streptosporangium sp. 'caverna']